MKALPPASESRRILKGYVEQMLVLLAAQIQAALTVADREGAAKEFRLLVRRSRLIHEMLCAKVEAVRQNAPNDALGRLRDMNDTIRQLEELVDITRAVAHSRQLH